MKIVVYAVSLVLLVGSPFSLADSRVDQSRRDQQCLALAMYWEARGEGTAGMLAVGFVVKNRAAHPEFPNTVCHVVHQGGERPPCQFSWWCDGKSDRPENKKSWQASYRLANKILRHGARDPTGGALYFHSTAINPRWRLQRVGRIGSHIFYQ